MIWPVENILRILSITKGSDKPKPTGSLPGPGLKQQAQRRSNSASDDGGKASAGGKAEMAELIARHMRLVTFLFTSWVSYTYFFPLDQAHTWAFGWVVTVFARNFAWELIYFAGWHWFLYESGIVKGRIESAKFNPAQQYEAPTGASQLSREKVYTTLGFCVSSTYEVVIMHMWATGRLPYYSGALMDYPLWSALHFMLVPVWRDIHFWAAHRMMHPWNKTFFGVDPGVILYKHVHKLHHLSHNPGPWSGLSMHPVESIAYFSCVLFPALVVPVHPAHMLMNEFHAAVAPVPGHDGFDQPGGGSLFHWLHHHKYNCNYGTTSFPLDKWFGTADFGDADDRRAHALERDFHVDDAVANATSGSRPRNQGGGTKDGGASSAKAHRAPARRSASAHKKPT